MSFLLSLFTFASRSKRAFGRFWQDQCFEVSLLPEGLLGTHQVGELIFFAVAILLGPRQASHTSSLYAL